MQGASDMTRNISWEQTYNLLSVQRAPEQKSNRTLNVIIGDPMLLLALPSSPYSHGFYIVIDFDIKSV